MILASALTPSLILSIVAATAYVWPALRTQPMDTDRVRIWILAGWLVHAAVLGWTTLGAEARFGFAPALSVTAWLVTAIYVVESYVFPKLQIRRVVCALGATAVMLAFAFPGSPLSVTSTVWLPVHLAFGVASYGLFGTAAVHAWLMTRAEKRMRLAEDDPNGLPLLTMEHLTYRFANAGFVLLSATLLVGTLFGDVVFGHQYAWRWDHKTVFSLLSWLTFAVLLLGRSAFGWRGKRAVRVLYMGTAFLLLAYVGSRFVLEVILGRAA
jgi:ABC-type uncharacterized transport system permease subunit